MPRNSWGLGLACEDARHVEIVRHIVGDAIEVAGGYCDAESLQIRDPDGKVTDGKLLPLELMDVKRLVAERGYRLHGHVGGEPLLPEAAQVRAVVVLFAAATQRPLAVVIARDLDGHPERLEGFRQVLKSEADKIPFPLVLAAPDPTSEAWYVAGFQPQSDEQHSQANGPGVGLQFSPVRESTRLRSGREHAPQSAKRVFGKLFGKDADAALAALRHAAKEAAAGRGPERLRAFVAEVPELVAKFR